MYLTAHPLPDERTAAATSTTTTQGSENDDDKDQKPWSREALYHFKYSIETPDRKKVLAYKGKTEERERERGKGFSCEPGPRAWTLELLILRRN